MPLPLLPIVVTVLVGTAYHQSTKREKESSKGVLTPERQAVFENAYNDLRDPEKLRKLAQVFKDQGLPGPASLLEKRAALRELSPEVKEQRRAIFRKAMTSQNPQAINIVADTFERVGALGSAVALRTYAKSLPVPNANASPMPGEVPIAVTPAKPEPPPTQPEIETPEETQSEIVTDEPANEKSGEPESE